MCYRLYTSFIIPRQIGVICTKMYRQETTQKIKYGRNEGELFDHTEVVFLNCPYCELKNWGEVVGGKDEMILAKYEE
jgi:hypothetical protein